jgi:imidazole glycerol-phosphate synthase subunit HisF
MKSKHPHYYGAALSTFEKAKALRKDSTPAEKLLWKIIRNRKMLGLKFRRQHPLKYFVADFYCHEALLVIEVDGSIHDLEEIKQYDKEREEIITELGITVLRFTNEEVFSEPEKIEKEIEKHLQKMKN